MVEEKVVLENAKLIYRNFSGMGSTFNEEGDRNFCVILEPEMAADLKLRGWNVKYGKARDEDDTPPAYIPVKVSYKIPGLAPTIVLVTNHGKTVLKEEDISVLDFAEIENADLVVRPYSWEVGDKKGVKAYLRSLYITIQEDEFADKYADVPSGDPKPKTVDPMPDEEISFP